MCNYMRENRILPKTQKKKKNNPILSGLRRIQCTQTQHQLQLHYTDIRIQTGGFEFINKTCQIYLNLKKIGRFY